MTEKKSKFRKFWEKFWFIVWKDDSFKGWIISILFIFIVIKFMVFPLISLAAGTTLPLAIVESCSMHHEDTLFSDFDSWWENQGEKYEKFDITKQEFEDFKLNDGFTKGDILFITGADAKEIKKGDIIVFQANRQRPVIHRVVEIEKKDGERYFSTIGDNNPSQLSTEQMISSEQIIGKASVRLVPYGGWIKLVFYEPFRPESQKGVC